MGGEAHENELSYDFDAGPGGLAGRWRHPAHGGILDDDPGRFADAVLCALLALAGGIGHSFGCHWFFALDFLLI